MEKYNEDYGICILEQVAVIMIIGEIEGHECINNSTKSTKYEHIIPLLIKIMNDDEIKGVLFVLNTIGGDVSCGLAIAEIIQSINKPTVSIVIGDTHSIGIPLAVATDYSYIVPTATVLFHPVRISGTMIYSQQTFHQFNQIQERIISFIVRCCDVTKEEVESLIANTEMLPKDMGTILVGEEAVKHKIITKCGNIMDAYKKIIELIE